MSSATALDALRAQIQRNAPASSRRGPPSRRRGEEPRR
jgi:hypothetical protein